MDSRRVLYVTATMALTVAPYVSPLALRYVVSAETPRIECRTGAYAPLSTGDGWSAWQVAEHMRAAEQFLIPIVVSTASQSV